jgi:hypothetical protein
LYLQITPADGNSVVHHILQVTMNVKPCAHKESIWCAVHNLTAWGSIPTT